jgi:hypothetical protein
LLTYDTAGAPFAVVASSTMDQQAASPLCCLGPEGNSATVVTMRLIALLGLALALFAQQPASREPFRLKLESPQVIRQGAMFPFSWVLKDGSALLEVSKGNRLYKRPGGFQYEQQDPLFLVSRDGLKTWQPWTESSHVKELPWFEGVVVQLRDGSVLMFEYIAHKVGKGEYEGRLWESSPGWKSLRGPTPVRLSIPQYEENGASDEGTPFLAVPWHRSVIEMPNGSLMASIYGRFEGDTTPSEYKSSMHKMRSFIVISKDKGKSWSYLSTIASAPVEQEGFGEPSLIRLSKGAHAGRLICVMRTGRVSPIYQSESDDNGKTWSAAHPLHTMYSKYGHWRNLTGTDPDLIEMQDGTLAMSFGHKPDYEDDGDFVAFSADQGESWTQVTRLSMELTCAYTSLSEIEPGVLYVTYSAAGSSTEPTPPGTNRTTRFRVLGQRIHVQRKEMAR